MEKIVEENTEQIIFNVEKGIEKYVVNSGGKLFVYITNNTVDLNVDVKGNGYLEVFFLNSGQNLLGNINLIEKNATAFIGGIYYLKKDDKAKIDIKVNHMVPSCSSHQNFRGIATGNSKIDIRLKTFVEKGAEKTKADQLHKSIQLSNDAVINAKPELEIYNDDVKCAHGNTIGALDKQALFYLQARGINEVDAREMLINGFLDEAVKFVTKNDIREEIFSIINGE